MGSLVTHQVAVPSEGLHVSLRRVTDVWLAFDPAVHSCQRSCFLKTGIFHEGWCAVGGAVRGIFVSLSVGVYNWKAVLLFRSRTFAQGLSPVHSYQHTSILESCM